MTQQPALQLTAAVLDAPDPRELARFYSRLLGWPVGRDEPDWASVRPPGGGAGLSFQLEKAYVRPTWPAGPGDQQMQVHLDIEVDDLEAAGGPRRRRRGGPGRAPAPGRRPGLPRPGRPPVLPLGQHRLAVGVPGAFVRLGLVPPAGVVPVLVPSGPVPVVPVAAGLDPPAAVRVRAAVVTAGAVLALLAAGPAGAGRPGVGVRRPGLAWTRDRRHPGPLARVGLVAVRPPPGPRRRAGLGPDRPWARRPDGPGRRPGHRRLGRGFADDGRLGRRRADHGRLPPCRAALDGRDHAGAPAVVRCRGAPLPGRGPRARRRCGRGGRGPLPGRLGAPPVRRLDLDDARPAQVGSGREVRLFRHRVGDRLRQQLAGRDHGGQRRRRQRRHPDGDDQRCVAAR